MHLHYIQFLISFIYNDKTQGKAKETHACVMFWPEERWKILTVDRPVYRLLEMDADGPNASNKQNDVKK